MAAHQYNMLQMAILAQLPRVDPEGQGEYKTAYGLQIDPDAHPLVKQASLRSLRAHLGILTRTGAVVRLRRSFTGRKPKAISYAVQPVKRA
jgi:hypothetical protein